jgi:hypothetical protein
MTDFSYNFIIDTTPPTVFDLLSPEDGIWVNTNLPTFSWNSSSDITSGLAKYQLYIDGLLNKDNISPSATSTTPSSALSEGSHSWYVKAVDNAGNTRNSSTTRTVKIDSIAPTISNFTPSWNSYTNNRRPTILATYSDEGVGVDTATVVLKLDGNTVFWQNIFGG